jgi:hypothetical protein
MKTNLNIFNNLYSWFDETLIFLVAYAATFLAPTGPWLATIGFLVIADMILAIIRAYKQPGGINNIQSRKLRRTITKFVVYAIAILTAYIIELNFLPGMMIMKLIAGLIAASEIKSIDENIEKITGTSLFKSIIRKFSPKEKKD